MKWADRSLGAKNPPLNITHITEAPGGVISYLTEVLREQAASSDIGSLHVLVRDTDAAAIANLGGVKVHSFSHRGRSLGMLIRLVASTVFVVKTARPDLVHVHSTIAGGVVRLCLVPFKHRPVIVYCPHGWLFERKSSRLVTSLIAYAELALSRFADSVLCISQYEKEEAVRVGIPAEKCHVILNGISEIPEVSVSPARVTGENGGRLNILYVGRFDYHKGFDTYLEVMRRLKDSADGVAIGDFVVERPRALSIPANVTLLGWKPRETTAGLFKDFDLILMPSRNEGFGLVAVEAMRAGLPVFASRVGGLPEVVVDGVTGRLFDYENVGEIIELIRSTSRATLREYGRCGNERFRRCFTASRMNSLLLTHYQQLTYRAGTV